jgi:hypothetical protein
MAAYDTSEFDSAPARLSPHLLGLVGERLAMSVSAILAHWRAGEHAVGQQALADLERQGVQLQQLARMMAHEGREPQEPIDLAEACRQVAAEWAHRAEAAGVRLRVEGGDTRATVNAAAFEEVLDLLVEHGVACGDSVTVGVSTIGQPAQPSVRVDITRRVPAQPFTALSAPAEADELLPTLAGLLARSTGLLLRRSGLGNLLTLVLSVPLAPLEPLPADDGALLPRTPSAAGGRVLIIDPRPASRVQAHHLLHGAGMNVDAVENVAQAHAALRDGDPDVLVVGLSARDPALTELIDGIRAGYPALRVIELVDEENAFAFSLPGADAPGRLSRSELADHLIAAVAQELFASRQA